VTPKAKPSTTAKAAKPAAAKPAAKKAAAPKTTASKAAAPKATARAAGPRAGKEMDGFEAEFLEILEDLQRKTMKEIAEKLKSSTAATSKDIGDFYDLASEERDRELELLLGDRERGKLRLINEAFSRLEEGTYGQCEECGEFINPKRLKIVPFARTCVDCQADKEHEERQMKERDVEGEKVYSALSTDRPSLDEDDEM
jgi:DnaK suppressor protein